MTDLLDRLEAGETPARIARSLGLSPFDLILAVARDALGEGIGGPSLVRVAPRRPGMAQGFSETALAELFPDALRPARLALAAGLLQIYNFWEASHEAAQQADDLGETRVSAYWHGIAHRREPDPGNAGYWFRRVGRHPIFTRFQAEARPLLDRNSGLAARLLPGHAWDPFAFIDLCTRAKGEDAEIARGLQRLEMLWLLEASIPDL